MDLFEKIRTEQAHELPHMTCGGDVVGSLTSIKGAIESVNEFIASTAAAVEEQSIVTSDMASNMQRASAELAA